MCANSSCVEISKWTIYRILYFVLSLNNQRKRYHTALGALKYFVTFAAGDKQERAVCARVRVVRDMVYLANEKEIAGKMGRRLAEPRNARELADITRSFFLLASKRYTLRDLCRSPAGAQCQVHRSALVLRALTHSVRFLFGHNYASCANARTTTFVCLRATACRPDPRPSQRSRSTARGRSPVLGSLPFFRFQAA